TIEGSTNIDFNSPNFKEEIAKLDKAEPVYVFCASGGRSGNAMRMMKDMGFAEVYNLNGGYMGWPYK
ncbi:MAG: rhodanese-like domain-containing protein, partial [Putridiphycobacter sp.]